MGEWILLAGVATHPGHVLAPVYDGFTEGLDTLDLRNAKTLLDSRILCIRHELTMLATDADFERIARLHPLDVWRDR